MAQPASEDDLATFACPKDHSCHRGDGHFCITNCCVHAGKPLASAPRRAVDHAPHLRLVRDDDRAPPEELLGPTPTLSPAEEVPPNRRWVIIEADDLGVDGDD
ncbi:MAG: hypothetical protein AAB865_00025 [Patescibacteria group bacterium]